MNGMANGWIALLFCCRLQPTRRLTQKSRRQRKFLEITAKGYTFAYPLVLMELTRRAELQRGALGLSPRSPISSCMRRYFQIGIAGW